MSSGSAFPDYPANSLVHAAVKIGGQATFEYQAHPWIAVGAVARLLAGVRVEHEGHEEDLLARVLLGGHLSDTVRAHAIIDAGISTIDHVYPSDGSISPGFYSPSGLMYGFGFGLAWSVPPGVRLTTEVTYHTGRQSQDRTDPPEELRADSQMLAIAIGFEVALW